MELSRDKVTLRCRRGETRQIYLRLLEKMEAAGMVNDIRRQDLQRGQESLPDRPSPTFSASSCHERRSVRYVISCDFWSSSKQLQEINPARILGKYSSERSSIYAVTYRAGRR